MEQLTNNLFQIILIVITLITTISSYSYSYNSPRKQYHHFDDYLINNSEKVVIVEVGDDNRESELINSISINLTSTTSTPQPTKIKESIITTTQSPEEKEEAEAVNCCLLGRLAGEHGYHCHVHFYAARIINRNENRAHNKKIYFNGKHRSGLYGASTMKKFESCIETRGNMFHKCCKITSRIHLQGPRYDTAKRLHSG